MSIRLDPQLLKEFKEYGAVGIEKCFNCGNCTAICPLASDEYNFPRDVIRRVQIGQKERLTEGTRSLVVLLLRRLFRNLSQRCRAWRNHDGCPPLVDRSI